MMPTWRTWLASALNNSLDPRMAGTKNNEDAITIARWKRLQASERRQGGGPLSQAELNEMTAAIAVHDAAAQLGGRA